MFENHYSAHDNSVTAPFPDVGSSEPFTVQANPPTKFTNSSIGANTVFTSNESQPSAPRMSYSLSQPLKSEKKDVVEKYESVKICNADYNKTILSMSCILLVLVIGQFLSHHILFPFFMFATVLIILVLSALQL